MNRCISNVGKGEFNMRNRFGKCLRTLIEKHEVKEQALADAINYNVTYISKWFNGAKLPSEKNVDRIISGFPLSSMTKIVCLS